jgi:LPXTG-site transpeptidase (sortase) family protein
MNRSKRRPWRLLILVVFTGVLVGVGYAVFMTLWGRTDPNASAPILLLPTDVATAAPGRGGQIVPTLDVASGDFPRLTIPTAGISALVIQLQIVGNTWGVYGLGMNVGHLVGTSPLMGTGNTVLVGHVEMSDGSPGVFAGIKNVKPGEQISLQWHGERRDYSVSTIRVVKPDDVSVLYPSDSEQLTLITCDDYNFFSNSYLNRVVVTAPRINA